VSCQAITEISVNVLKRNAKNLTSMVLSMGPEDVLKDQHPSQ
jgi:hypothetical protein